jgi:outer membrane assembly lipoprotein YfiO
MAVGNGCLGRKKEAQIVPPGPTPNAGFERAMDLLSRHDLRQATAALKRIQFSGQSRAEIEPLTRLALADATYYQNTKLGWIDARGLYLDFVTLNGDHPLAPYAQLQVGLCSLKQVARPSRDQGLTQQAIRDLTAVEDRWPDSIYVGAARNLLLQARATLAESEFLVGRFYLKRKAYAAAIDRFRGVLIRFPEYPDADKLLFHLARAHERRGEVAEARLYLDRIVSAHPHGEYAERAQRMLEATAEARGGAESAELPG